MAYNEHKAVGQTDSMYPPPSVPSNGFLPPPYASPDQAPPFTAPPDNQYPPYQPQAPAAVGQLPAPAGQPYYQQPPGVPYGFPPGSQQQVIVVGAQQVAPNVVYVNQEPRVSMMGAIVLSCFAFWCCGGLLGGIAFILAMVGLSSAASGDRRGAIQMRNASYGLSIAGIVIAFIIAGIVGGIIGSGILGRRGGYYYYNNNYYYTYYYYTNYYYTYYYYGKK